MVATEELGTCEEHLALEEARDLITYEGGGHVSTGRWPRVNGEVATCQRGGGHVSTGR